MRIDVAYESAPLARSERTAAVQDLFGIGAAPRKVIIARGVELDVAPGKILLVTGPSGSGKSSILRALTNSLDRQSVMADSLPGGNVAVIDSVGRDMDEALRMLGVCGLSEAYLMLRNPAELSDGQKYRLRLALTLASGAPYVVADEFCSLLDRTTAKVIACNIRKLALRYSEAPPPGFILATAHEDIIEDLQPDTLVRKGFGDSTVIEQRTPERKPVSFFRQLEVEPGGREDWRALSEFHYKSKHLGAVDRIFRLRLGAQSVGVVVYAYPAAQNSIRNRAFAGRYCGRVTARERRRLLNRELRVVQRIVIDPRLRGLGLASHLLRETVGRLDVPFVECIAVMAGFSRFLENAGFVCLGRSGLPKAGRNLLGALRGLGLDNSTIHDPGALSHVLQARLAGHAQLAGLLRRWWATRRQGVPCPLEERLDVVAREVARHVSSRPFYYLYDNRGALETPVTQEAQDEN